MIAKYSVALAVLSVCTWLSPARADDDRRVIVVQPQARPAPAQNYTTDNGGLAVVTPEATVAPSELPPGQQYIAGRIERVKERKDAAGVKHKVATVTTDSGAMVVVDLGPSKSLHGLDLDKHDRLTLEAVPGTFNGESMFLATRVIDEDGKTAIIPLAAPPAAAASNYDVIRIRRPAAISVEPSAPAPAPSMPVPATPPVENAAPVRPTAGPLRTVQGQVLNAWTREFPGYGLVQLAQVRTQDGDTVTVDLGPRGDLPRDLSLTPGSWVQVTGRFAQSGDQQVLLGETLTRSVRIAR